MKKALTTIGVAVLVAFSLILILNGTNVDSSKGSKTKKAVANTSDEVDASEEIKKWSYRETEDKMTSKTTYMAHVSAKDMLQFDFPYQGGSLAMLTIRDKGGATDVFVSISKGQFNSTFQGGSVK